MRRELLTTLHCPFSGSPLQLSEVYRDAGDCIEYGIVTGEGGEFPILAGILRLLADDHRPAIVDLLKRGNMREALLVALDVPFHDRGGAVINGVLQLAYRKNAPLLVAAMKRLKRPMVNCITDGPKTFVEMARKLGSRSWADWQINRFSAPNFVSVYPLLHLMKEADRILDFGSGIGHASFLISRIAPQAELVCADYSFSALYLARKFFIDRGDLVCLDGDFPLPFATASFSGVLSCDAMHFVTSKRALAQEFVRIAGDRGVIVLAHMHNRFSPTKSGYPLSPAGYRQLFAGVEARLYAETELVDRFVRAGVMDLTVDSPESDLGSAIAGLSLVASGDHRVFRRYDDLWDDIVRRMRNPVANPSLVLRETAAVDAPNGRPSSVPKKGRAAAGRGAPVDLPEPGRLRTERPEVFLEYCRRFRIIEVPERFG